MKNKKLTYFLVFVVLVVWGLIIYRVVDKTGANDDQIPVTISKPVKEAYNDFSLPKDTTHLLLNYRDPFGLIPFRDTANITKHPKKTVAPEKVLVIFIKHKKK